MKKLKSSLKIGLIGIFCSIFFLACTKDDTQVQETKSIDKTMSNKGISKVTNKTLSTNKIAPTAQLVQTICDITGPTVTSTGVAVVAAGSTASYSYTNNTGSASNIVWTLTPSPAGSATYVANGANITITYLANFASGTLTAAGSGGTAQTCNTVLNITNSGSGANCSCTPVMTMSYICRGSSSTSLGGFVSLKSPTNCQVDWSTVEKIDLDLSGAVIFEFDSPLSGLNNGTLYPPFIPDPSGLIVNEFYYQGCLPSVSCKAKIYFNNGCPAKSLTVTAVGG
ncbi:hypothetical protein [Flavobacterium aestivum]|uniref:hypothetical protein n=1 Tax=Flavobacterium aestivum TaxID=3003257 RepID=UPI002285FE98|nr:hypothetical protein [Flavobacterium aestivum]